MSEITSEDLTCEIKATQGQYEHLKNWMEMHPRLAPIYKKKMGEALKKLKALKKLREKRLTLS